MNIKLKTIHEIQKLTNNLSEWYKYEHQVILCKSKLISCIFEILSYILIKIYDDKNIDFATQYYYRTKHFVKADKFRYLIHDEIKDQILQISGADSDLLKNHILKEFIQIQQELKSLLSYKNDNEFFSNSIIKNYLKIDLENWFKLTLSWNLFMQKDWDKLNRMDFKKKCFVDLFEFKYHSKYPNFK